MLLRSSVLRNGSSVGQTEDAVEGVGFLERLCPPGVQYIEAGQDFPRKENGLGRSNGSKSETWTEVVDPIAECTGCRRQTGARSLVGTVCNQAVESGVCSGVYVRTVAAR